MQKNQNGVKSSSARSVPRSTGTHSGSASHFLADASLPSLLAVARRRILWIVVCLIAGWGLAAAYYVTAERQYESTARVLVMQKDPKLATTGAQSANTTESRISEDILATHIQLVQSQRIVSQALAENGLDQLPSILDKLRDDKSAADYVIENLYVTRGGTGQSKTAHVIQIAFRHTSEEDAKVVVEAIVESYRKFLGEKFQDVNKEAADLIAQAQKDLASELEDAEQQYTQFRQQAPLLWNGDQSSNTHRDRYEQIQTELGQLQLQATEAKTRLEVVEEGLKQFGDQQVPDLELLALIDEKNATRLGLLVQVDRGEAETAEFQSRQPARLETARAEYESMITLILKLGTLMQDFGPNHPDVITTKNQIESLQKILDEKATELGIKGEERLLTPRGMIDAYVRLLRQDLATIKRRETELLELASKEAESAKALVKYELDGESLKKAALRKQDLYDAVVDRLREINLAKDYGGFINEVIQAPELGEQVAPNLLVVGFLGTLGGLMLSVGMVSVAEFRDRSFRTSDEIHNLLGIPVLTHVPNLAHDPDRKVKTAIAASGSALDATLRTFHRPKSREAEIFRGLRTNLFFSADGKKLQVIECTSPNQGDGKSTLAGNLAVSIAQTGRKVLIVDCDLRRPRLHEMFGLTNDVGLTEVIMGESEPWDAVQATEVENLVALPCGELPDNPAELLTSPAFENFLNLARERYDYVVLDCPPVLVVADPCIVAPRVDGVVMAVRVSKDSRPQTLRAKEMLAEIDAPLVGVVVNCWDAGTHYGRYGYGSHYGTGYGYGYGYGYSNAEDGSSKYYEESDGKTRRTPKKEAQRI